MSVTGLMMIKARPWPDIFEHYRTLVEDHGWSLEPMLELVRSIDASPYMTGLVAYTSMLDLIIAQSEANFERGPELWITFDYQEKRQFIFTYREQLFAKKPWTRKVAADEGFEVLERFLLKRVRWFKKPIDA